MKIRRKQRMNRTRRSKGAPPADPGTLKDETVRKGTDGKWWVLYDGKWNPIRPLKARKTKKAKKDKKDKKSKNSGSPALGMITVKFNTSEKCDLIGANCILPECSDFSGVPKSMGLDEWHHAYREGTPPYGELKYAKFDQYIGSLALMPSIVKQLQAYYGKYKRGGVVSEFQINSAPWP